MVRRGPAPLRRPRLYATGAPDDSGTFCVRRPPRARPFTRPARPFSIGQANGSRKPGFSLSQVNDMLDIGDSFPRLTLDLAGGAGTLSLPDALEAGYNVVLFYRGHW